MTNSTALGALELSPRIANLREVLLKRIPCTEQARKELEDEPLRGLIVHYLNYASRFIPPRPRQVSYAAGFWTPRALEFFPHIFAIEREVGMGVDLTPRLSKKLAWDGFAARKRLDQKRPAKWASKDFALNAFGVHHLHIGELNKTGSIKKADELLYVRFFRDWSAFIMIGDHESFDDGSLDLLQEVARGGITA
jgi:hypothetical protein